jgi:hypothetical protein
MRIISTPANLSPAYGGLIYTIGEVDASQAVTVEVIGGTNGAEVLARKRFRGLSQFDVNIAPYIRRTFDPQPQWTEYLHSTPPHGQLIMTGGIRVGSLSSGQMDFTGGIRSKPFGRMLSDSPEIQTLAPGECVQMAGYNTIETLNHDYVADAGGELNYRIPGDDDYRTLRCTTRRQGALRLCWLNPYGAYDYYTFNHADGGQVEAAKALAFNSRGTVVCDSEVKTYTALESEPESRDVIRWLAQVIASPRVFACEGSAFRPVEVAADNVELTDKMPSKLRIRICERQTINY